MNLRQHTWLKSVVMAAVSIALSAAMPAIASGNGYRHDPRRGDWHGPGRRDHDWHGNSFNYRSWHGEPHHWVSHLPAGYIALTVAGLSYFYYDGLFYQPDGPRYVVVNPPLGAVVYRLPYGYHTYWFGPRVYYFAGGTYYQWAPNQNGYVVVPQPAQPVSATDLVSTDRNIYVYPLHGQSDAQTSRDRYECYLWAVNQTGYDPSESGSSGAQGFPDYKRALSACLEGRGYTVK